MLERKWRTNIKKWQEDICWCASCICSFESWMPFHLKRNWTAHLRRREGRKNQILTKWMVVWTLYKESFTIILKRNGRWVLLSWLMNANRQIIIFQIVKTRWKRNTEKKRWKTFSIYAKCCIGCFCLFSQSVRRRTSMVLFKSQLTCGLTVFV